jgi:GDP-D-mannose dehydratase
MPTCLVTGGAGFLGSHLCEELLRRGNRVICVDNLETGSLANIEHIRSDSFVHKNLDIIEPYFVDETIDFVYHLASPASPIDYLRLPLHTLKVGSYVPVSSPRPRARSTAIPRSTRSPRATGATSTRSAPAASTTRRSDTRRR